MLGDCRKYKKKINSYNIEDLSNELIRVRFRNNKARYVIAVRDKYFNSNNNLLREELIKRQNIFEKRDWLVSNIKGIGYKEASHFLRNIGFGKELAILDRHILKNLVLFNIVSDFPKSLSRKRYIEIELKFKIYAESVNIPLEHLDLLFWFKETGELFK